MISGATRLALIPVREEDRDIEMGDVPENLLFF